MRDQFGHVLLRQLEARVDLVTVPGLFSGVLQMPLMLRGCPRLRLRKAIFRGVRRAHLVVARPEGERRLRIIGPLAFLMKIR